MATAIIDHATGTAGAEEIVLTATYIVREATRIAARETAIAERLTPTATPTAVTTYVIQEGDTLLEVALQFDTTLQTLADLNPQIDFSDCDFTRLSGGSNCVILLIVGDEITVPFYDETATVQAIMPTPTPMPYFVVTTSSVPTSTPR